MASAALFDLLPDFGAASTRAMAPVAGRDGAPPPASEPPIDIDVMVARAVAEAEAALEQRLAEAHETELETLRQAHAEEARAFLESLGEDVGKTIATRVYEMEAHVADRLGEAVARIVGNLLGQDLLKRSLDALAASIRESLGDSDAMRIGVSGPQSMFEALSTALGPYGAHLDFVEAPGFDLTVTIDDAVLETRMAEWAGLFTEVLS